MKTISIKYHDGEITEVHEIEVGDWIDLRAGEDLFIPFMEMRYLSLGVSMELPEGYEAHLLPRSSTFERWGLMQTNGMGVIDGTYCGDGDIWKSPLFCLIPKDSQNGVLGTLVRKNDRICQFRIIEKQPKIRFKKVSHLGNKDRGGFGSTGTG